MTDEYSKNTMSRNDYIGGHGFCSKISSRNSHYTRMAGELSLVPQNRSQAEILVSDDCVFVIIRTCVCSNLLD